MQQGSSHVVRLADANGSYDARLRAMQGRTWQAQVQMSSPDRSYSVPREKSAPGCLGLIHMLETVCPSVRVQRDLFWRYYENRDA